MIDWDDVRYFLAVARAGSVRAAAQRLGVNHATVLRRVAQLEDRLGVQMFEKLPSGYRITSAGEEVLELADRMEATSNQLEGRVFGRDQSVRGLLRVTLAPPLATHLLMPDLAEFARLHPDIEMDISSSGELANLTNREADVAIRVVYDRKSLPLNLHGLKGPDLFGGVYVSRDLHRRAACRRARSHPLDRHQRPWGPGLGRRGRGSHRRSPVQGHGCRISARGGPARARHHDAAVFRRGCRSPPGQGAGDRPAHVRDALAPHPGGSAEDEARAAVQRFPVPQACGARSACSPG